jgi:hypothetical protein
MALPRWEQMTPFSAPKPHSQLVARTSNLFNTLKALEFKTSGLCSLSYLEEGLKRCFSDTRHGSSLERLLWGEEFSGFV